MIKNKYQRLNKKERKEAREKFYATEFGQEQKARFNRILLVSVLLFIYGIYLLIETIIKANSIWGYVSATTMFIFALVFAIGRHKVIIKNVNDYLIKKKK